MTRQTTFTCQTCGKRFRDSSNGSTAGLFCSDECATFWGRVVCANMRAEGRSTELTSLVSPMALTRNAIERARRRRTKKRS